jgi:oligosaccharide repeat unit polymerase
MRSAPARGSGARAAFFTSEIAPDRLAGYAVYCILLLALLPVAATHLDQPGYLEPLVLAFAIGLVVPAVIVFKRRVDLIDPINWFSLMYLFVFPGAVYFLIAGFGKSEHLLSFTQPRVERAATAALWLFLVGYLAFVAGYATFAGETRSREIRLPSMREFSPWIARLAIAACVAIGALNFLYLLVSYPGGMLGYLLDFGLRSHRFEMIGEGVTTVGYQFIYAGVYLWLMVLLRENKLNAGRLETWLFVAALVLSIVMSISQGRMGQTVTYVLAIGFLVYVTSAGHAKNFRYVALIAAGMAAGIVLYLLRRASAANFTGAQDVAAAGLQLFASSFFGDIAYWIIGKGNVPNVPIVMNLLETGGINGHLLYGASLYNWVFGLTSLIEGPANIGATLGMLWFGGEGGLPPTIVGEFLVNFGALGVPVGMCAAGAGCALLYRWVRERGDFIWYVVYLAILLKFIFLWPKGEAANLAGAIWAFVPTVVVYNMVRMLTAQARHRDAVHRVTSNVVADPASRAVDTRTAGGDRVPHAADEVLYVLAKSSFFTEGRRGRVSHAAGVIGGLDADGCRVTVLSGPSTREHVRGERVSTLEVPIPGLPVLRELIWLRRLAKTLERFVGGRKPWLGVVVRYSVSTAWWLRRTMRRHPDQAWVFEVNSLAYHQYPRLPLPVRRALLRIETRIVATARLVYVVSRQLETDIVAMRPELAGRIVVVPNGGPSLSAPRVPQGTTSNGSRVAFAYLGVFQEYYEFDVCIAAFRELRNRGCDAELHFFGYGGQVTVIEAAARTHSDVHYHGRYDLGALIASGILTPATVLLLPNRPSGMSEIGSPIKLYEYLSMGLPVIASDVGQAALVLVDGESGILYRAGDVRSCADAMQRLASDAGLRSRLAARAWSDYIAEHTWEARMRALHRALRSARIASGATFGTGLHQAES